jgi:small-conductance mechanosensitive channel
LHWSHTQNHTRHTSSWIELRHNEHMCGGPPWQRGSKGYHYICARRPLHNIPSHIPAARAAAGAAFVGVAVGIVVLGVVGAVVTAVFAVARAVSAVLAIAVILGSAAAFVVR